MTSQAPHRRNPWPFLLVAVLAVCADPCRAQEESSNGSRPDPWDVIAPHFSPPEEWKDQLGDYRSPDGHSTY